MSGRAACAHDPFLPSHRLALDASRIPTRGTRPVYGISAHLLTMGAGPHGGGYASPTGTAALMRH